VNAHLEEAERAAEDGGPRARPIGMLVSCQGCGLSAELWREPSDPPEATRLVYHSCEDHGAGYHYENEKGERL
jgi:hypothetical protein